MDVETPNVSAMTNDERTPLIDRAPRARVTKPAAWVWAIVMVTCLAGVIFLGVSGNLHQNMGVSGNNQDAAAVHAAGDSSHLGVPLPTINCPTSSVNFAMSLHQVYGNSINVQLPRVEACTPKFAGQRKCVGVGGNTVSTALPNPNVNIQIETPQIDGYSFCSVKTLIDELKSSSVTPTKVKTAACQLVGASSDVCRVLTDVINHAANLADQIADLKNMHTLSDLQNNAIIPPDIKNAVSTVVDSIDGVKRDVVSLFTEIGTTMELVADAVVGSTLLIDAVTKAPDKLFTALLDKVIPTNAYNLVTMLKVPDLNAASAGGAAALGASAPAILHPDNTQALRLLIREALGVETENVTEVYGLESVSEHHARLASEMEAALGGDKDEGSCFPMDIPIFDEFMSTKEYEMPWPEKLGNDVHAPDAFEIRLPKFKVSTCFKSEFQLPLHAGDVLVKAFIDSFAGVIRNSINAGFDAVNKVKPEHIKAASEMAQAKLQCISGVVNHLSGFMDKAQGVFGRRLLEHDLEMLGMNSEDGQKIGAKHAACDDVHGLGLPPGRQGPLPAQKRRVFPLRRVHADTSFGSEFGDDHESGC